MAVAHSGLQQYVHLEQRLVLLGWLNDLFGYERNRDLLADVKETAEGWDAEGRSYVCLHMIARGGRVKIPQADLERYDANIQAHLAEMNARRSEPITLRYFQYLAALYSEVYLDRYFRHRDEMLRSLNAFVRERNARRQPGEAQDSEFASGDLRKLAFWMATGSGKTLIMHLNYRQFLHYNTAPLDNILLITPNEGLSQQHLDELAASGIPARRFDINQSGLDLGTKDTVRVIEITKLVQDKRGGGVSVPVEAFEGNNLILVDEGHKGSGGEAWRGYRDALGQTGFTFEYSATFGQALTAARNDELTAEYGKAIAFDYSYRYFHGDGYGKDFRVLNLTKETSEEQTETLLLGNLLSFYEQQLVYEDQGSALRPYNLERPLWVFVGGTVNAVFSEDRQRRSDVLTVARFLHHVLENRHGWVAKTIQKLLDGQSGLRSVEGGDVFAGKFAYVRGRGLSAPALYQDILERVLRAKASSGLHLCDIRGCPGEIGLKAGGAEDYFGLIYIGDTSQFKALVQEDHSGITLEEDAISGSLFDSIGQPDTTIEVLIGAKKFMEGWNSWRVSNMGLLNIGRQEGSQIIQLFGRGVRLRGKDMSLKRSSALTGTHPQHVGLLETLNIFAVRADYMTAFRLYLEREGVETEEAREFQLELWTNNEFLGRGLVVPRIPEDCDFCRESAVLLEPDEGVKVNVDLSTRVETIESGRDGIATIEARAGAERAIPDESLDWVDWERAYLDLLDYKRLKGLTGLVVRPEAPRRILSFRKDGEPLYTLLADEEVVQPRSFAERSRLQEAVTSILRKYADALYRQRRKQWEGQRMVYRVLDQTDPNLGFNRELIGEEKGAGYVVRVPRSRSADIAAIQKLIDDGRALYEKENDGLKRIYFDRHLYLPLLEQKDEFSVAPPGLKPSEAQFVRDLKKYWEDEKDGALAGKQLFLLRNLSRSGIGFFAESGFYPDFLLWVVQGKGQRIVFIEPHGMVFARAYQNDAKARLHEALPALAREIAERSRYKKVTLDSFVVSATPFPDLKNRYDDGQWDRAKFAEKHILFQERGTEYDYIKLILS